MPQWWRLFELLLPRRHPEAVCLFSSDFWHQQGILAQRTAARWIFSQFWTILYECVCLCVRACVCENPSGSAVCETLKRATCHPHPCDHVQSHLKRLSPHFNVFLLTGSHLLNWGNRFNLSQNVNVPWRSNLSMTK